MVDQINTYEKTTGVVVWTKEADTILRDSIMQTEDGKTASDAEVMAFKKVCDEYGMNPFRKEIFPVARWNKKKNRYVWSYQISVDGQRTRAARTGELGGEDGPYWCGPDGLWCDVWLKKEAPAAAKVVVYRKGCDHGFTGIARFDEYAQKTDYGLTKFWKDMPANQIAKCAESLALRKAFPETLGGIYTREEMEQDTPAEAPTKKIKPAPAQTLPAVPLEVEEEVEVIPQRPGDCNVPEEETNEDGWTDEQQKNSVLDLGEFVDALNMLDCPAEQIEGYITNFRSRIGVGKYDTYLAWSNRNQSKILEHWRGIKYPGTIDHDLNSLMGQEQP
jgi:phage recombination protein Bet